MTQTAVVTEVIGNKARIQVKRVSACAHDCEKCGGGCSEMMKSAPVSVLAKNPLGARIGDKVVVASDSGSILRMAVMVYVLPIILFFAGYFVARSVAFTENAAIMTGGLCFGFSLVFMILFDRVMRKKNKELFTIVEICRD